ncbi:CGGC domain-containing protein [Petroclostridium sp. X23]|uniref:CGGC domain-containing protein n=1 Tax=Petroclostridium sp. X23 TaxID=3045146 RepID=UPI0024ADFC9B|nr:CGGC domain-containing protein [Petroclostridium sp. X23]WHH58826.1 CGGC domain-containing protein [Petroclostridium sp. X23]
MMKKIGIIICGRYQNCGGGKCFRALRERVGGFSIYPAEEQVEVVGYSYCGGCPGGNIEYVPEEMIKNGAQAIHLATGFVVGYPPCPSIENFKEFIEVHYNIPVIVGTHPIPMKYFSDHEKMSFWANMNMKEIAPELFEDAEVTMKNYD